MQIKSEKVTFISLFSLLEFIMNVVFIKQSILLVQAAECQKPRVHVTSAPNGSSSFILADSNCKFKYRKSRALLICQVSVFTKLKNKKNYLIFPVPRKTPSAFWN